MVQTVKESDILFLVYALCNTILFEADWTETISYLTGFSYCRYSGKTQKQIVEYVRDNYVKRQTFQRYVQIAHLNISLAILATTYLYRLQVVMRYRSHLLQVHN